MPPFNVYLNALTQHDAVYLSFKRRREAEEAEREKEKRRQEREMKKKAKELAKKEEHETEEAAKMSK
ncbi:hypothetical protein QBC45DRAFT_396411 [Copromyces sp. CBS 386.78]|nr:hypothetical protein QBC45DRAFT_396411 [Copromyces sp. CBS 386.78]